MALRLWVPMFGRLVLRLGSGMLREGLERRIWSSIIIAGLLLRVLMC
jgi:hypothetical protein